MRRLVMIAACLAVLPPSAVSADSEQRLPSGATVRWHQRSVDFVVDASMRDPSVPDPVALVQAAANAWHGNGHVPRFVVRAGPLGAPGFNPDAAVNTSGISLYRTHFPQRVDRAVLALTLLTRNSVSGEIVDADVLVDAERNRFARLDTEALLGVPGAPNDFQNVITHEFGHVLGLVEDPDHAEATMFPSSQPGEVSKRKLSSVDRDSARRAYARAPSWMPEHGDGALIQVFGELSRSIPWLSVLFALALMQRARWRKFATIAALVSLVWAVPGHRTHHTVHGVVLRARTLLDRGVMRTRAEVQTAHGLLRVERIGGRIGRFEQRVYDAPSGHELREGASVSLGESP